MDSALVMAVGFKSFPERQHMALDVYDPKGAGSILRAVSNMLTSR